ncbi:GTP cyclohydrolase II [Helicobacter canis]|uniref:GTP cyclohydrolase-2 n=1 Tax=Helicobacter canis TaxID=29419 RepID=A0A377J3V0_9HELI|nr:GTP cyclohydrolase II [Helicobacter canis]STO97009.1 GTP cyclohydrolase II [Helicobacter canis]
MHTISNLAKLPTRYGDFLIQSFRETLESSGAVLEHLVVMTPHLPESPLVRVHSECLTGDVFGSCKCDCGPELDLAMRKIAQDSKDGAKNGGGMLIYLRQEGRGIGLFNKVNAYALQDQGLDTVEANIALGFASDDRNYGILEKIFTHYGIKQVRLLTNNPRKIQAIGAYVKVERASIIVESNEHNAKYLAVKKQKLGHLL